MRKAIRAVQQDAQGPRRSFAEVALATSTMQAVHWESWKPRMSSTITPGPHANSFVIGPAVINYNKVQHLDAPAAATRAKAAPGPMKPSEPEFVLLLPLMRAHEDAVAAQEEGIDLERLSRTYAALALNERTIANLSGMKEIPDLIGLVDCAGVLDD